MKDDGLAEFVQQIARKAASAVLERFGNSPVQRTKRDAGDPVTEADLYAEKIIVDAVRSAYPDHGIIAEEGDEFNTTADYVWYIDPIDGTRNFATNTPLYGVMIAVAYRDVLQCSVILLPSIDELYFAARGAGAFCNGKRIHCGTKPDLAYSYGCYGASLSGHRAAILGALAATAQQQPFSINSIGSAAVSAAWVAAGKRDWWITRDNSVWDYAAPALLLREAGCLVTTLSGEEWTLQTRSLVAANPALHAELRQLLGALNPDVLDGE